MKFELKDFSYDFGEGILTIIWVAFGFHTTHAFTNITTYFFTYSKLHRLSQNVSFRKKILYLTTFASLYNLVIYVHLLDNFFSKKILYFYLFGFSAQIIMPFRLLIYPLERDIHYSMFEFASNCACFDGN